MEHREQAASASDKPSNLHTPEDFQQHYRARTWEWYKPLLNTCIEYGLQEPVLDLGCGLGLFTECCTHHNLKCLGLEGAAYAVEQAKIRCPDLDIRQHDLNSPLPVDDRYAGSVMLHQVIEHIDPGTADFVLQESYRVLRPNGRVFVFSPSRYNPQERDEPFHINMYSPKELIGAVQRAEFSRVEPFTAVESVGGIPIFYLGYNPWMKWVMRKLHRIFPAGRLAATANCIGIKNT